ncbi:MAG TPA: tRNA (adenosine(37)-N6)-dimethylallyltransferase MiaA [Stellaceae bacterium]|nr:tRNA (adenosine(37)-N6)-dimethylallyltransferase MiaA [Stellaceae bacterium]
MTACLVIAGVTASGKSGLALALAERLGGTVINADSMQIYRDLDVLTARPGAEAMAAAPHRLYGVLDGAELCSAARWAGLAKAEVAEAVAGGRVPILCGGTGLYLRTLLHGIASVPAIPDTVRAEARALHAEIGGAAFRAALARLDPAAAGRLAEGDSQRLIRAYEVAAATGTTLGDWQKRAAEGALGRPIRAYALLPPRDEVHGAIDARVSRMVAAGALEEVRRLVARGLDPALPVMKAVGVRELASHLRGETSLAEAIEAVRQATRRYAKRQYTWFRHQLPEAEPIAAQFSERNAGLLCQKICNSA